MADDDSCVRSKWPLLQFGTCKLKGLRKRDGLPLCQGERPEADSFSRVERRDKEGLFESLTERPEEDHPLPCETGQGFTAIPSAFYT